MRERLLSRDSYTSSYHSYQTDNDTDEPKRIKPAHVMVEVDNDAVEVEQDDFIQMEHDSKFSTKCCMIVKLAIPNSLSFLMGMIQENINTIILGQLNKASLLAGVGIGNVLMNMSGLSIAVGLNGALETLVSQAYGVRDYKLIGVYLNRSRIILLAFFVPVVIFFTQTSRVLQAIGQDKEVSQNAQEYVIAFTPGLILAGLIDNQRRFLNMVGKSHVPMICQSLGTMLHGFICYYLVWVDTMGIQGVGLAGSISNGLIYAFLLVYTWCSEEIREAISLPNKHAFQEICQYLKLGIPSAMMLCLEWWAFEVICIMVGYIGVDEQAANVVIFQIVAFLFMIALGFSQASCALIGQQIGNFNIPKAKEYFRACNVVSFCMCSIVLTFFIVLREQWLRIFTNNDSVVEKALSVEFLICF